MFRKIAFSFTVLLTTLVHAEKIPGEYFVKIKTDTSVLNSPEVLQYQHLFNNNYWVKLAPGTVFVQSANLKVVAQNQSSSKRDLVVSRSEETDPKSRSQFSLLSPEKGGMNVTALYNETVDSPREEVIVAVVDTGVDYNHEDLRNKMWINEGEISGDGIDNDGNGYVDDVYGINTLDRDTDGNATGDISDDHSHGTHVSGIIAAERGNEVGISGVSQGAKIMAIRTVPSSGDETDRDVIESFIYAAKMGAKVINCSFGKDNTDAGNIVEEAIDYIGSEYGVLVVAAAGNSSRDIEVRPAYPAALANLNLFTIAASTSRGARAYFSNYGNISVDIAAAGARVLSTTPGNKYEYFSGTSMASPNVAGAVAELLSLNPSLEPIEAKQAIMDNAFLKDGSSFDFVVNGLVDVLEAHKSL